MHGRVCVRLQAGRGLASGGCPPARPTECAPLHPALLIQSPTRMPPCPKAGSSQQQLTQAHPHTHTPKSTHTPTHPHTRPHTQVHPHAHMQAAGLFLEDLPLHDRACELLVAAEGDRTMSDKAQVVVSSAHCCGCGPCGPGAGGGRGTTRARASVAAFQFASILLFVRKVRGKTEGWASHGRVRQPVVCL